MKFFKTVVGNRRSVDKQFSEIQSLQMCETGVRDLRAVEAQINGKIRANLGVDFSYHAMDEAQEMGAMALFGEKYSDDVRTVTAAVMRYRAPLSIERRRRAGRWTWG